MIIYTSNSISITNEANYKEFVVVDNEILFLNETSLVISVAVSNLLTFATTIKNAYKLLDPLTISMDFSELTLLYDIKIQHFDLILSDINMPKNVESDVYWRSFSLTQFGPFDKLMMKTRGLQKTLNGYKKVLQTGIKKLNLARDIIKVTKNLMAFYQDTTKFIIKRFIEEFERTLMDIQSSGIYFLDMTSYHFDEINKTELDHYYSGAWWQNNDKKEEVKPKNGFEIFLEKVLNYKRETYYEFIDKLCFHLTDPNDTLPVVSQNQFSKIYDTIGQEKEDKSKYTLWGAIGKSDPINNFKTGRPDFGTNSKVGALVVAISLPDFVQLIRLLNNLIGRGGLFEKFFASLGSKVNQVKAIVDFIEKNQLEEKAIREKNQTGKFLYEIYKEQTDAIKKAIEDDASKLFTPSTQENYGKEEKPYWVGVTMGSIFGFLFEEVFQFLDRLKKYVDDKGVNFTILDTIDEKLQEFIQDIKNLIEIIENIDRLLEFINALLSVSNLAILHVEVKPGEGGINGIVSKIKKAEGFFRGALSNYKHIEEMRNKIVEKKNVQLTEYLFENDKYTYNKMDKDYRMFVNRYAVLEFLYNNSLLQITSKFNELSLYNNVKNKKSNQIQIFVEEQELVATDDSLSPQEKMDKIFEINEKIEILEGELFDIELTIVGIKKQTDDLFDFFINKIYSSDIWPYEFGEKVFSINDVITADEEFKQEAGNIIVYNNTLIKNVNLAREIDGYEPMLDFVKKKAEEIYFKENREDNLKVIENKFIETKDIIKEQLKDSKKDKKELESRIAQNEIFDLNAEMYFAGCAFVWGVAAPSAKGFTNWSDIKRELDYQDEENRITIGSGNDEDAFNKVDKIIKKIF